MTGRVAVVGSLNLDLVVHVERHPEPGETVMGGDVIRMPGGKGANQAVAAARAGAEVHLVGRVGEDADGQRYLRDLTARGVNTRHVRETADSATGAAMITVAASGENSIVVAPGANARVTVCDVDAAASTIESSDVLVVQLEIPMDAVARAVAVAAEAGVRVVVNPSPVQALPAAVVQAADPAIVNEHEAGALGLADPCVTRGSNGATWRGWSATPAPAPVVDTTGAGDVFAGTLAACLASGLAEPDALKTAVDAATEATTWHGAQGWRLS